MPEEEKGKNFNNLLKLYQEEVDRLTKRSKFAEGSFLSIYELLSDAPNPNIALVAALDISSQCSRVGELEQENKKYKTELEEFKKEFNEIKNQEVSIRRLEDKVKEYEVEVLSIYLAHFFHNESKIFFFKKKV